ncbi:MAG: cyclic nucleotide-binding domain-containing protein, partial [Oligoflexia bacterium]|nr:cyclic nucleotide-binding domain-containing protein [Oligoflexia bacterium]
ALPMDYQPLMEYFNGEHSVKDITSLLYQKYGRVSFNSIMTAIHLLGNAGLLEELPMDLNAIKTDKTPHQQKSSLLFRPFFELTILKQIRLPKLNNTILFVFLAIIIIAASIASYHLGLWNYKLKTFLRPELATNYANSFLIIFVISSTLITLKNILKGILLIFCVGQINQITIRPHWFSLAIAINETSIFSQSKRWLLILYGISSSLLYLAIGGVIAFLITKYSNGLFHFSLPAQIDNFITSSVLPSISIAISANDIKILSILLTCIELDPYRNSEMTKLFNFFYAEDQLKNLMPYLKNCSLTPILNSKAQLADEIRFVIYSVLSFIWAIGLLFFSLDLLATNLPNLIFDLIGKQSSAHLTQLGMLSTIFVLFLIVFIFLYLLIDLIQTIFNNVISPIKIPLSRMVSRSQKCSAKEIDQQAVKNALKSNMFFKSMSEDVIDYIIQNSPVKKLPAKKYLITQGDVGKSMFLILEGNVDITIRNDTGSFKHLVTLGVNTLIGELAYLKECRRSANVVAVEQITFLEIEVTTLKKLFTNDNFKSDANRLLTTIELSQFVSTADIFRNFPAEIMNIFIESGDLTYFPANYDIVTEGERDKTFYLLIRGSVDVIKGGQKVAELKQGDIFGEIALIADIARTATVRTREKCLFLFIEGDTFWKILSNNIDLAMYIESVGRHRMSTSASASDSGSKHGQSSNEE